MTTTPTTHPPETNFGTATSWLPLLTPYPSQPGCFSTFYARWGFIASEHFEAVAFDPAYGISVDPSATCLPAVATSWWDTGVASLSAGGVTTRYSIGPIVCPVAYTIAGTSVVGVGSTQVACCPSGFGFASIMSPPTIGQCTSSVSIGTVVTYVMQKTPGNPDGGITTTSTTMAEAYYIVGVHVNGVNFAALSTTTSTPSLSSIISSASLLIPLISSSPSSSPPTTSLSKGLSTGAKAGIGVSALIAIVIIIALVFWIKVGRRRKTRNVRPPKSPIQYQYTGPGGTRANEQIPGIQEVEGNTRSREEITGTTELEASQMGSGAFPLKIRYKSLKVNKVAVEAPNKELESKTQ